MQSYSWGQHGIPGLSGNVVKNNSITNCTIGVESQYINLAQVFDARENWWGDTSGPSGRLADPVTGTVANGSGPTVTVNVLFDRWLTFAR